MTSSYEGGTTRNTLRALLALDYTRRNAPDPGRGFEGTRALMEKKLLMYRSKSGLPLGMLVHCQQRLGNSLRLQERRIGICHFWKLDFPSKEKGELLCNGGSTAENEVLLEIVMLVEIVANYLVQVIEVDRTM